MTRPICVLITGVSGGSIGEQIYKALRFGKNNYKIIAANIFRAPMAVVKAECYAILPPASSDNYIVEILNLINQQKVQFIIPGSEPELVKLSLNRDILTSNGSHLLINNHDVISTCVDKQRTFDFLSNRGFKIPKTFEVKDIQEINTSNIPFPVIIKPSQGGGGSSFVFIAQDQEEMVFFVKYLLHYGYNPIIQEYLRDAEHEYTIGILHSHTKHLIGSIVLQRNILSGFSNRLRILNCTKRQDLGKILAVSSGISQGKIVHCKPIREEAEKIAEVLGSSGPLNIQGRWDGESFSIFEINPRFSGTTPMRAMANFNEPELLINSFLGLDQTISPLDIKYGEFSRGLMEYFTPEIE